jgi:hypothetical protein
MTGCVTPWIIAAEEMWRSEVVLIYVQQSGTACVSQRSSETRFVVVKRDHLHLVAALCSATGARLLRCPYQPLCRHDGLCFGNLLDNLDYTIRNHR